MDIMDLMKDKQIKIIDEEMKNEKSDVEIVDSIINLTLKGSLIWQKQFYSVGKTRIYTTKYYSCVVNFKISDVFPYLTIIKNNKLREIFIAGKRYEILKKLLDDKELLYKKYDFILIEFLRHRREEFN